jgi:hypothetical protein
MMRIVNAHAGSGEDRCLRTICSAWLTRNDPDGTGRCYPERCDIIFILAGILLITFSDC